MNEKYKEVDDKLKKEIQEAFGLEKYQQDATIQQNLESNDEIIIRGYTIKNFNMNNLDILNRYYFKFVECKFKELIFFSGILKQILFLENCEFLDEVWFSECEFLQNVVFINCHFTKVDFSNCKFTKNANFRESKFKDDVFFHNNTFDGDIRFPNSRFEHNSLFTNCHFTKVDFRNCKFTKNANFNSSKFSESKRENIIENINFENCQFMENLSFRGATFSDNAFFANCKFTKEADFSNCNFIKDVNFCGAKFEDIVKFSYATFSENIGFEGFVFKNVAFFNDCKFMKVASFYRATFENTGVFSDAKFNEYAYFVFTTFEEMAKFDKTKFKGNVSFGMSSFGDCAYFKNCEFMKNANFYEAKFQYVPTFKDAADFSFGASADFTEAKFNEDANFTASKFKGYANFSRCKFENKANFHSAIFENLANFYGFSFKSLDMVNVKLNFEMESIQKAIVDKEFADTNANDNRIEFINEIRDSFCNIKNFLITNNNLLDAQEFRKAELYCKEKELKYKIENDVDKKHKFSRFFSRENIDILLLAFYRTTSDHHTNFVKILNFTALVVAYYAAFLFGMEKMFENDFCYNENFYIAPVVIFIFLFFCLFLLFAKNKFCSLVLSVIAYAGVVITLFCQPSAISPLVGIFDGKTAVSKFEDKLYNMQEFEVTEVVKLVSNDDDLSFEDKVNLLIKSKKTLKNELESKILKFKTMCYYEHKILNQIYIYEIREKSLKSIGLIYFLFMILVLFSLQKTARKNSVVPI